MRKQLIPGCFTPPLQEAVVFSDFISSKFAHLIDTYLQTSDSESHYHSPTTCSQSCILCMSTLIDNLYTLCFLYFQTMQCTL